MTPAQCRAARGLLNWNQAPLATQAGVRVVSVRNLEKEKSALQPASLKVMRADLESASVVFVDENGREPGVKEGRQVELEA
jgi:hypothetical protein